MMRKWQHHKRSYEMGEVNWRDTFIAKHKFDMKYMYTIFWSALWNKRTKLSVNFSRSALHRLVYVTSFILFSNAKENMYSSP